MQEEVHSLDRLKQAKWLCSIVKEAGPDLPSRQKWASIYDLSTKLERMLSETICTIPPEGWWCSREAGHEGPCAAREVAGQVAALEQIRRLCLTAEGHRFDLILSIADNALGRLEA